MMDQQAMLNEGAFQAAGAASYSLAEIWPFPVNNGGESGVGLDLRRRVQFGQYSGQFADNASVDRDVLVDDPMILDQRRTHNGRARKRREKAESSVGVSTSSTGNGMNDRDSKRPKIFGSRDENHDSKVEEVETDSGKPAEQITKPVELPQQDYIHVRARRGQATDSHSLAERARREKISERMKVLQDLVPNCNKVIGKALVLDEIINYIQSLQRQVEFLLMKLEAVSSPMNPSIEGFPSKDFCQQAFDTADVAFGSHATREYSRGSSPESLHMQIGGGFERTT